MKKKTIEEAAEEYLMNIHTKGYGNIVNAFIAGAEWYAKNQGEQMYSEGKVNHYVNDVMGGCNLNIKEWKESKK
jgi:hypothetical protein